MHHDGSNYLLGWLSRGHKFVDLVTVDNSMHVAQVYRTKAQVELRNTCRTRVATLS